MDILRAELGAARAFCAWQRFIIAGGADFAPRLPGLQLEA